MRPDRSSSEILSVAFRRIGWRRLVGEERSSKRNCNSNRTLIILVIMIKKILMIVRVIVKVILMT